MRCTNIKCPYYIPAEKPDWAEKTCGVTAKQGGCKTEYCKLQKRKGKR